MCNNAGNGYKRKKRRQAFLVIAIACISYFFLPFHLAGQSTAPKEQIRFRVMEWNLENLFNARHDTLKDDREFLPDAIRHWNYTKYKKKLADIACGITAVGEWEAPALVGLCEVESDTILRDLVHFSPLRELGYRYVITDSPDLRGIDVALLYQRDLFKLLEQRSISIPPLGKHRPTRDLLHVSGLLLTGDTLDVLVCHMPSRSGGAKASEPYRLHAARQIRLQADSILNARLHPQLIIMGDFNDYPTDKVFTEILQAFPPTDALAPRRLYHLLARKAKDKNFGSYKYQGEWGLLDHLLVSGALLDNSSDFYTHEDKANVARLPFLLKKDEKYGGDEPFRTYKGMKYQGGISDHLPIYTDFILRYE